MAKKEEGKVIIYVEGTPEPVRATEGSWGVDLFASENVSIGGGSIGIVGLGIKMNFNAQVAARSSLWKHNVIIANGIGIIDADYRWEVKAPLFNIKPYNVNISKGEKLCQILIAPEEKVEIRAVSQEEFDNRWVDNPTERGEGGIGSTDSQTTPPAEEETAWTESDSSDEQLSGLSTAEWEENSEEADDGAAEEDGNVEGEQLPAEQPDEKKSTKKSRKGK